MKDLITQLAQAVAPSGSERQFQETLLSYVKDLADEVKIDRLGNGIARKHGDGPHIVLAAHADEQGVMVIDIDDHGFLRIIGIGEQTPSLLVGRSVRFTNDEIGVVGAEDDVKVQDLTLDHLYIDIGAATKEEAQKRVHIGLSGVVVEPVVSLTDHLLTGRALDNRVGCAIAIEAFREAAQKGLNVSVVFTAQNAVGARGAKTAAYQLEPDFAIVIDATPAGDTPEASRNDIQLGAGPAVKIMDSSTIVPIAVKDHLIESAERAGVQIQYEVWTKGRSDAGNIQLSVDGILVGGVSYPARYTGRTSTVVDLRDAKAALDLVLEAVRSFGQ
ncbi:M42 family peptidase [Alicyclobacillus ferrooxydans]|uniref:Peptidase M42 n=1 Tax=Alicyclobacillus ferrooxydans TaxID=471514 RepID=A0A0P9EN73_9BACL|nr:M42 family peptidase [Alicyclobacillus ferrooxydans]KPV44878.1 peptidase M42 [Alicyclobacillus ferrooxydans]